MLVFDGDTDITISNKERVHSNYWYLVFMQADARWSLATILVNRLKAEFVKRKASQKAIDSISLIQKGFRNEDFQIEVTLSKEDANKLFDSYGLGIFSRLPSEEDFFNDIVNKSIQDFVETGWKAVVKEGGKKWET